MLSTLIIGTMTLKPMATKADSKIELTAGVSSYINAVMLNVDVAERNKEWLLANPNECPF